MNWLKKRVVEVSTWRGVGALAVTLGLASAGQVDAIVALGMGLVSIVEVVRGEK